MERWLDNSRHPIWHQIFPREFSDEELIGAFDHLDECVRHLAETPGLLSFIVDISRAEKGNSVQRQRISESFRAATERVGDRVLGQAFIVQNRAQRGAMTATLWLFRPPWPIREFADSASAFKWLDGLHAQRHSTAPPPPEDEG